MLSKEHEILLTASRLNAAEDHSQKLRVLAAGSIDMHHLIDLAVKEGLGGILYKGLLKAGLHEHLDPRHSQRLYTCYYLTIRHNLKLNHALNNLLEAIREKETPVVLMQGIALLQQIYQDVGLRPMTDLDIWVLPRGYQDLVDVLLSQGFTRAPLYPDTFRKGEIRIDLHTHILWADRIRSRAKLLNETQEEIYRRTEIIDLQGNRVRCLGPQDQFIYLSLHALKHNLERLIWLFDLRLLTSGWEEKDWRALVGRAEDLGHRDTLFYILFLLAELFNVKPPPAAASRLLTRQPSWLEQRILQRRVSGSPIPTWAQFILICKGRGWRVKFSFFIETLFPRPAILRQIFANSPRLSVRQLYWKRVLQIIGSYRQATLKK